MGFKLPHCIPDLCGRKSSSSLFSICETDTTGGLFLLKCLSHGVIQYITSDYAKCPWCEMVCDVNSTKLQICLFRMKIIYFEINQLGITMCMLVQWATILDVRVN